MKLRLVLLGTLILLSGFLLAGFAIDAIIQSFATWIAEGHRPPAPQHQQAKYLALGGGLFVCIGLILCIAGAGAASKNTTDTPS